jgi:hypothetical protein
MTTEESDRKDTRAILDRRYQSVIVALDIENHAAGLEDARFRVRGLYILRILPERRR